MTHVNATLVLFAAAVLASPFARPFSRAAAEAVPFAAEHPVRAAAAQDSVCPYDFGSPMPEGVFCLYSGVVMAAADGEICDDNVAVIWSSYDSTSGSGAPNRSVLFAFAGHPELVVKARTTRQHPDVADLIAFAPADEAFKPAGGRARLVQRADGAPEELRIRLVGPNFPVYDGCAFNFYRGVFVGVMEPPVERARSR